MPRPSLPRASDGPRTNDGIARPSTQRAVRAPSRRSRGQALVEFAIVLPVFLLVLSGVLDFGFLLYGRMTAINAIKEVAQCGSTGQCTVDSAGNSISWSAMQAKAIAIGTADGLTVTPTFTCEAQVGTSPITWTTCNPAPGALMSSLGGPVPGDAVLVTATYQYQTFFPLLFGTKIPVTVSNQMVIFPPPPPN
ncbi:MAG TPA: TadE/TadG family type IV pilus assembly protein [Candidatus Limnocylindrales bacterium]|nr:TadE/TadG family type IV pilus assembly protein [Candidatus Limnocylindrales bacterium]